MKTQVVIGSYRAISRDLEDNSMVARGPADTRADA